MIGRCSPLLNYFFVSSQSSHLAVQANGKNGGFPLSPFLFLFYPLTLFLSSFLPPSSLFFLILYLGWFSVSRQVARATIRSSRIIAFSNCRFLPYRGRRSVVSPFFVPVETSIEKGDFFFSSPPLETPLSPGGGGGIRWWNSMADFNGLWKVKIREKLLLEATSPISRKLFSPTLPSASASTSFFFSPFLSLFPFPLCVSVFPFSFLFSSISKPVSLLFSSSPLPLFLRDNEFQGIRKSFTILKNFSFHLSFSSVFFQFMGLQSTQNLITLHALSYHQ